NLSHSQSLIKNTYFRVLKRVLLQPKTSPFEKRKGNTTNTHYYIYMQSSITSMQASIIYIQNSESPQEA
ncbi:hypothetical protein, partial [Prevotella sp.]|uniref:hypothetical protein n=1 Tax=Prevotella sp. TaxID=59823 RepID=UPI002ABE0ACB